MNVCFYVETYIDEIERYIPAQHLYLNRAIYLAALFYQYTPIYIHTPIRYGTGRIGGCIGLRTQSYMRLGNVISVRTY